MNNIEIDRLDKIIDQFSGSQEERQDMKEFVRSEGFEKINSVFDFSHKKGTVDSLDGFLCSLERVYENMDDEMTVKDFYLALKCVLKGIQALEQEKLKDLMEKYGID